MLGAVETVQPELSGDFATVMGWADDVRRMKVRANAETPEDAKVAREFERKVSACAGRSICFLTRPAFKMYGK